MNGAEATRLDETAVVDYETLRSRMLDVPLQPCNEFGIGVLLRQGMLAWLRVRAAVRSEPRVPHSRVDATRVATELHDELIHVMVAMAMTSNVFTATQQGVPAR